MIKIAYCPTMEPFVRKLSGIDGLEFFNMGSAAQAFMSYLNKQADAVLVGRAAYGREKDKETIETRLKEGLTLVYQQKTGVDEGELANITVWTYLDASKTADFNNLFMEIIRKNSLEACLEDGLQTPVLLDWKDFRDEFQLLIPLNPNGKVPLFRAPVLYHRGISQDVLDNMKKLI